MVVTVMPLKWSVCVAGETTFCKCVWHVREMFCF